LPLPSFSHQLTKQIPKAFLQRLDQS